MPRFISARPTLGTFRSALLLLVASLLAQPLFAKPLVVSSIRPVQLLIDEISGGRVESRLLLPAATSPHLYNLRPSDRRLLAAADAVFWIGPELERFLHKPLAQLPAERVISLGSAPGVVSAAPKQGSHDGHDHHEDKHGHGAGDPHSWLSPQNAIAMARLVSQRLLTIDPSNEEYYLKNVNDFESRIQALDKQLLVQFSALTAVDNYIVLHDAYNHFEQRYGLHRAAALTISPDRRPGARHLWQIEKLLDSDAVICVFREPQYQPAQLEALLQGRDIAVATLDPLATAEVDSFSDFFADFAVSFQSCLIRN